MASNDYHDYVIKDGRFIGKFEEMYRKTSDPWRQDEEFFVSKHLSIILLKLLGCGKFKNILDIGCGKGKITGLIKKTFASTKVCGIDISKTAIETAKKRYPDILFRISDITKERIDYSAYDCIFMTDIIWYILPEIERIFSQIYKGLKNSGGVLILNNHLYQKSEQKYGREHITTIETLLKKIPLRVEYIMENNRFTNYDITLICTAARKRSVISDFSSRKRQAYVNK